MPKFWISPQELSLHLDDSQRHIGRTLSPTTIASQEDSSPILWQSTAHLASLSSHRHPGYSWHASLLLSNISHLALLHWRSGDALMVSCRHNHAQIKKNNITPPYCMWQMYVSLIYLFFFVNFFQSNKVQRIKPHPHINLKHTINLQLEVHIFLVLEKLRM